MKIAFEAVAFADFVAWAEYDRKIQKRIVVLITDILRNPYQGIGKPEPLKQAICRATGHGELPGNID